MDSPLFSSHLVALNASGGQVPSDIHLLPKGTFRGRDGRGPWRIPDPAKVIAATQAHQKGAKLLIDYDHQREFAGDGHQVRAAGWITGLRADGDGIHGRVEWTAAAAQMIADQEYRYVSPVFTYARSNGEIGRICNAGLTNNPNLDLIALNTERRTMSSP
ncbi:phage protease, partial [Roseospira navarrensis]